MKKLLNTLYVTTPDSYLSKDGTNVVVSSSNQELFRIPIQNIEAICTFGYQGASPGVMKLCVDNKVELSFFTPSSKFIARIQGSVNGNVYLRRHQYGWHDKDPQSLHLSQLSVFAKIYNSRVVLRRYVRDYSDKRDCDLSEKAAEKLLFQMNKVSKTKSPDELRGIEGEAAAIYFDAFPQLILNDNGFFIFNGRNRRPPQDPVNAMLSFGYAMLAAQCSSALEGVGLDPGIGFMHTLRSGRNSLALDLVEEFRAYLVDRFVLSLINSRQFSHNDFLIHNAPDDPIKYPILMTDAGRKKFLQAWQSRKKTEITHPFLNEKIPLGLLPHVQAMLLARYLRGDLDDYPVFFSK